MDVRGLRLVALSFGLAMAAAAAAPVAAQAAGLIAAYERYETGRGFEIGLVNASTGARLTLPAGVNTTDDELHPSLSVDGRYLTWVRMRLLPKLNGDIPVPSERTLFILDRQTGTITAQNTGSGAPAGPSFANRTNRTLTWGVRPHNTTCCILKFQAISADNTISGSTGFPFGFVPAPAGQTLDGAHVAMDSVPVTNLGVSWVSTDANSGALLNGATTLVGLRQGGQLRADFGDAASPTSHPVFRRGDQYVALDKTTGSDADIQTIAFPDETALTPAPAPITTSDPERTPAWSPGGLQLGFVRTTGGRRVLPLFDLTPGIQTILNPPIDLGADAPTPQTRAFQSSWGGLSIAESSALDVPVVTCTTTCLLRLQTTSPTRVVLSPTVSTTTKTQTIGIVVARVTGKRKLLGRTVPRIRPVGRVPLGKTRKGRNSFRWNGKVAGKRLKRGTYLLTYRALRRTRIVSTSGSIRFKVNGRGQIRKVKRVK